MAPILDNLPAHCSSDPTTLQGRRLRLARTVWLAGWWPPPDAAMEAGWALISAAALLAFGLGGGWVLIGVFVLWQ